MINVKKILFRDCVLLGLKSETKDDVITEVLDHLVKVGKIKADRRDEILKALFLRESRMSTGMQFGIAIPHCKTAAIDEMVAALAISKEGVDFNSLDGEPSRIFVMTVSPIDRAGPHLQFLAEISRLLNDRDVQQHILAAETPDDLLQLF